MARNESQQLATLAPGTLPETLSASQGLALAALLSGKTMTSAAQAAGVNRTTVWRWLHDDPDFLAFYNAARSEMASSAEQSLRLLSARAVVTLRRLMTRRSVPDAVKLQAALAILKMTTTPVMGPVEPEDAANAIHQERSNRNKASRMASIFLNEKDLVSHLKRPIDAHELEEMGDTRDDDLDDLDDDIEVDDDDDLELDDELM